MFSLAAAALLASLGAGPTPSVEPALSPAQRLFSGNRFTKDDDEPKSKRGSKKNGARPQSPPTRTKPPEPKPETLPQQP
jgi:hypothetical protein